MIYTKTPLTFYAATGSALLLLGAYTFEYMGYPPCQMCYWQRWPHMIAICIAILSMLKDSPQILLLGALSTLTTAVIGAYHSGVEQGWWPGPSSCTGTRGLTGDLLSLDEATTIILCDKISWAFAGLSMPTWNSILSLTLAFIWLKSYKKSI